MNKICSFTGHRLSKFSFKYNEEDIECIKLKAKIIEQIEKMYLDGVKIFLTGCAMGVDIWCGEIVLQLMKKYDDMKLYCILPCNNIEQNWSELYKQRLKNMLNDCTKTITLQQYYSDDCFFKRNRYLVDKATVVFGVYDINCDKSGTKNTLNYAKNMNKDIVILNIEDLEIYKHFKF